MVVLEAGAEAEAERQLRLGRQQLMELAAGVAEAVPLLPPRREEVSRDPEFNLNNLALSAVKSQVHPPGSLSHLRGRPALHLSTAPAHQLNDITRD